MDKESARWSLHWPKEVIPDDALIQYPDLQKVDKQIKFITDSISIEGNTATLQGKSFNITDFPMNNRIAQRELVRVSGIKVNGIESVKIGRRSWEIFDAFEIVVIGIFKRLMTELPEDHNPYFDLDYRELEDGDIVEYGNRNVRVSRHFGAHLMKYYREGEELKPILPSAFIRKVKGVAPKENEDKTIFSLNEGQLEMTF